MLHTTLPFFRCTGARELATVIRFARAEKQGAEMYILYKRVSERDKRESRGCCRLLFLSIKSPGSLRARTRALYCWEKLNLTKYFLQPARGGWESDSFLMRARAAAGESMWLIFVFDISGLSFLFFRRVGRRRKIKNVSLYTRFGCLFCLMRSFNCAALVAGWMH